MADELGKFSIETPEQVSLDFTVSGIGSRSLALFVDSFLQAVVMVVAVVAGLSVALVSRFASMWAVALLIFVYFAIFWGYFTLFETIWKGQTPGKRLLKIRVIKADGRSINVYDAMIRNIVRIVDFLPSAYAVGVFTMFIDRKNRRLGDLVAGTLVIHDREHALGDLDLGEQTPELGSSPLIDVSKLRSEHLAIIERFLARRLDIDYQARLNTGQQLATMIKAELGNRDAGQELSDEAFLQAVARSLRDSARFR